MPPNLDSLPQEIINQILQYFPEHRRKEFATVSKSWQGAVERETFPRLKTTNLKFKQFKKIIFGGNPCRLEFLRSLRYTIFLPRYDTEEKEKVDKIFSHAVRELFEVLHVLDVSYSPAFRNPLDLSLSIEQANTEDYQILESEADDIFDVFFPDSPPSEQEDRISLELQDLRIPRLDCVTSLTIVGPMYRPLGGRTIASLASSLPRLESLDAVMCNEWKSSLKFLRLQRYDSALLVHRLHDSIKHLTLRASEPRPCREDLQPLSSLPLFEPTYDRLSVNLRQLSTNLTSLTLNETRISASLFWPQESESPDSSHTMPHWPHLEKFTLKYPLIDGFGNWMFGPHPERDKLFDDERDMYDNGFYDPAVGSSGDEEDSEYDYWQHARKFTGLDGLLFRCDPSPYMPGFYIAAARAAKEMPKLRRFLMQADFASFKDFYADHEFYHEFSYKRGRISRRPGKTREIMCWRSNLEWVPPEDVVRAWKEVGIGKFTKSSRRHRKNTQVWKTWKN